MFQVYLGFFKFWQIVDSTFKANILFTILFSLLLILVLLVWFLTPKEVKVFCNIIIYWLFIIQLHLFLIFNRFNTLINENIKLINKNKNT